MNPSLSPRESQVLSLFSQGMAYKEIAHQLSISPRTVEHHLNHIKIKLGVENCIQALVKAIREGILK
jgi:DNA-binding CsgD family transcriptional regulator